MHTDFLTLNAKQRAIDSTDLSRCHSVDLKSLLLLLRPD